MSRFGAGLLLFRDDGRILLLKRSRYVSFTGYWSTPGGSAEPGETPLETALRESEEELGNLPPIWIYEPPRWHVLNPWFRFATFLAQVNRLGKWKPMLNIEHVDWGWYSVEALSSPLMPGTQKAIEAFG